jgi:hypothetical protein
MVRMTSWAVVGVVAAVAVAEVDQTSSTVVCCCRYAKKCFGRSCGGFLIVLLYPILENTFGFIPQNGKFPYI